MGLTASAKNALRISLPHGAANEVIRLLDRLADEFKSHPPDRGNPSPEAIVAGGDG